MTEDSRDDLMAQVRNLNTVTEAMKNHPLPPQVAEMAVKLEEKVRYLSWVDVQEERAELQAKAAKRKAAAPKPPTSPLPSAPAPAPVVVVSASKSTTPDPERRLARLRALGGEAKYRRSEWKFKGITALVKREKSEHRKRSDEKTIRVDLKEAAQNELEARRAGFADGLGQR